MNDIKIFEGQEVRIKTNEGNTLINLVHVAKCCGLTRIAKSGNEVVQWKKGDHGVYGKLKKLRAQDCAQSVKEQIDYVLNEIDEADDRNTIYISSWLAKRLAVECFSEKAMKFKNFLIDLDEAREQGQLVQPVNAVSAETVLQLAQGMQSIGNVVQGMQATMNNIATYVKDSIQSKDVQIDKMAELVGLRSVNRLKLIERLKEVLSEKYGRSIKASSTEYQIAKNKVFKEFDVIKWEDIPVNKLNNVYAFIEEVI